MKLHLTNEEIDDIIVGEPATDRRAHLQTCPICVARLAAAFEPIANFNIASLAWGERRSATLPLQLRHTPAGLVGNKRIQAAAGVTAAVALALVVAFPQLAHRATTESAHRAFSAEVAQLAPNTPPPLMAIADPSQSQPTDQQIARDNQLLQAIDRELASSDNSANLFEVSNQSSPDGTRNE